MNVKYVNLLAADMIVYGSDASPSQPIYNLFENFSNLFYKAIDQDLKETENNAPGYISCKYSGYLMKLSSVHKRPRIKGLK